MRGSGLEQRDPRTIAAWEWAVILVIALTIVLTMAYAVVDTAWIVDRVELAASGPGKTLR